jgi:hypothetical protein
MFEKPIADALKELERAREAILEKQEIPANAIVIDGEPALRILGAMDDVGAAELKGRGRVERALLWKLVYDLYPALDTSRKWLLEGGNNRFYLFQFPDQRNPLPAEAYVFRGETAMEIRKGADEWEEAKREGRGRLRNALLWRSIYKMMELPDPEKECREWVLNVNHDPVAVYVYRKSVKGEPA